MWFVSYACWLFQFCLFSRAETEGMNAPAGERRVTASSYANLLGEDTWLTLAAEELVDGITIRPVGSATTVELGAGVTKRGLELFGSTVRETPEDPQVRFVKGTADSSSSCSQEDMIIRADSIGGPEFVAYLNGDGSLVTLINISLIPNVSLEYWSASIRAPVEFLKGGSYRLCYSDDGSFLGPAHAQLLSVTFSVPGIWDSCTHANCLAEQPGRCYRPQADEPYHESNCSLRFGGVFGNSYNMTLSSSFSATYDSNTGELLSVASPKCGKVESSRSGNDTQEVVGSADALDMYESYYGADGKLHVDFPIRIARDYTASTVAVCYCPDLENATCADAADFTQQVGRLFFYAAALCDPAEGEPCSTKYEVVAAGQPFFLRILCPPLGCRQGNTSRIKIVAHDADNFLPSWHSSSGCRAASHLMSWLPRGNCANATNCSLAGGERQDYRSWGTAASWWAWEPDVVPGAERLDLDIGTTADICFCDGDCNSPAGEWFTVGMMQVVPITFAVLDFITPQEAAGLTNSSFQSSLLSVAGVEGTLGFSAPTVTSPVLGFKAGGVVKLILDPDVKATAADCEGVKYATNPLNVSGLDSWEGAELRAGTYNEFRQIVFDGGLDFQNSSIIVHRSGIMAVCYCSTPSSTEGCEGSFIVAGRLRIRGPTLGQKWVVSIGGLFNIEYAGHGLKASDTVRLSQQPCTADPSQFQLAANMDSMPSDISTWVLSDSTVGCDELGTNCRASRIYAANLSADGIQLDFSPNLDPELLTGDEIVIGNEALNATAAQTEAFRGRFTLGGLEADRRVYDLQDDPEAFKIDICRITDYKSGSGAYGPEMMKYNNASFWLASWRTGASFKISCPEPVLATGFRVKSPVALGWGIGIYQYKGTNFKYFSMQYSTDDQTWNTAISGRGAEEHGGHFQTFSWGAPLTAKYWRVVFPAGEWDGLVNKRTQAAINYMELLVAARPAYFVPHRIFPGDNSFKRRIRLRFGTSDDVAPQFDIDGSGASWVRENMATTRRELLDMSTKDAPLPTLHVCWRSGYATSYSMEAGTVSFMWPPPMSRAVLSLVAPVIGESVPAILAFETGGAAYPVAKHGTALVLRFLDTAKVAPLTASGTVSPGISNAHARQGGCGGILLETWSSDSVLGFPLPRSCRFAPVYMAAGGRSVREVEIQFESYNGLMPNTQYQVVLNVRVSSSATIGEEVVHVVSTKGMLRMTSDVFLQPNQAVEVGLGILSFGGQGTLGPAANFISSFEPVGGQEHPTPSGTLEVVQLESQDRSDFDVLLRLTATNGTEGVAAGSNLRILLWPLLQWDLAANITVECVPEPGPSSPRALLDDIEVNSSLSVEPERTSLNSTSHRSYVDANASSDLPLSLLDGNESMDGNDSNVTENRMSSPESVANDNIGSSRQDPYVSPDMICESRNTVESLEEGIRGQINSVLLEDLHVRVLGNLTDIEGTVRPVFRLHGRGGAIGGFFLARPAIVVSNADMSLHQYFHQTSGAALHKQVPPLAMIVTARGDANSHPFPGDTNSLWVRMLFPSSVPAGAVVKIQPREAYPGTGCKSAGLLPEDTRLNVSLPPYGNGFLRAGAWSTRTVVVDEDNVTGIEGSTTCYWAFETSADSLYASSSTFTQVTLQNPLRNMNTSNRDVWRVTVDAPELNLSMSAPFTVAPQLRGKPLGQKYENQTTVLSVLPFFQISPSKMLANVRHTMWIFFSVANTIYPSGYVELNAPHLYDFGDPCTVLELDREYYRYGGAGVSAVLERLPRYRSCKGQIWPAGGDKYTQAVIAFDRPLYAGYRFGFGIQVTNPPNHRHSDQAYWGLVTRNVSGFAVDKSRGCVAFSGKPDQNCSLIWGLYSEELSTPPNVRFGEMVPYFYTRSTSYVTLFPFRFPRDIKVPIRVTAPLGYVWEGTTSYWQSKPPGANAYWPYFTHIVEDAQLLWADPVEFKVGYKYGFRNPIHVPLWPLCRNDFLVEFGFQDALLEDANQRPLVLVLPSSDLIRVVRGPRVDYLTGRAAQLQTVSIKVSIVAALYPGEGFVFAGFKARDTHEELRCSCPPAQYTQGLNCSINIDKVTREVVMRLKATNTIANGYHSFPFSCQNSVNLVPTSSWRIGTFQAVENFPNVVPVDGYADLPGFGIQPPMRDFTLLPPTLAAGADFRPDRRCGTILMFRLLTREWTEPSFARLRAPEGTIFQPECLDEVITSQDLVFGKGVPFNTNYSAVPPVHLCVGIFNVVRMTWEEPLIHGAKYVFRVNPINPSRDPVDNVWTIEIDGEASTFAQANHIQTFINTSVIFASQATLSADSVVGGLQSNRVRFLFTPSVSAERLIVTAPDGFYFGDATGCAGLRLTRMHSTLPMLVVPRLSGCLKNGTQLNINFRSPDHDMVPMTEYSVEVDMLNPNVSDINLSAPIVFRLQAYRQAALGGLADEIFTTAPTLAPAAPDFTVENVGNILESFRTVPVRIRTVFDHTITYYQRILFTLPILHIFEGGPYVCPVTWNSPIDGASPRCECDNIYEPGRLPPTGPAQCFVTIFALNGTRSAPGNEVFTVPWPAGKLLDFTVRIANPGAILGLFDNYWNVHLYPPVTERKDRRVRAIGSYRGWRVMPPLSQVNIGFGSDAVRRAGATSAILSLSFNPPSEATHMRLTALSPSGWDFFGTDVCIVGLPACLASDTKADTPTVLDLYGVNIQPGKVFDCNIRHVKNADVGGPATFTLNTFIQDQDDKWYAADSSGTLNSFTLPGDMNTSDVVLRTQHYLLSDPGDTFWAKLPPRLNTGEGLIQFYFTLTVPAYASDYLAIRPMGNAYDLRPKYVTLASVDRFDNTPIPLDLDPINRITLNAYLKRDLTKAPQRYLARVGIYLLEHINGSSTGAFLNVSFCRLGETLPINTNDGVSRVPLSVTDWVSSGHLAPFTLLSTGISPTAETFVVGTIPSNLPTLIAPPGLQFVSPCQPTPCASIVEFYGGTDRPAAVALNSTDGQFSLRVILPRYYKEDRQDWSVLLPGPTDGVERTPNWASAPGFRMQNMGARVAYAAVSNMQNVHLFVSFTPGAAASRIIPAGGDARVDVRVPLGYTLFCGSLFRAITVRSPTTLGCIEDSDDPAQVMISMTQVHLEVGDEITFVLGVNNPVETPEDNRFMVVLRDDRNVTIDANPVIPGTSIPAQQLESNLTWHVPNIPDEDWFQHWAKTAEQQGVFQNGVAAALNVPNTTVTINHYEARAVPKSRRLEQSSQNESGADIATRQNALDAGVAASRRLTHHLDGELRLRFSVSLRVNSSSANYETRMQDIFADNLTMGEDITAGILYSIRKANLQRLDLQLTQVNPGRLRPAPNVSEPELMWSTTTPGTLSRVSVRLTFNSDTDLVSAVLIVMPDEYSHELHKLDDLRIVTHEGYDSFPVAHREGGWIDAQRRNQARIYAAEQGNIKSGRYGFDIPVRMPSSAPVINVWYLCLCSSDDCASPWDSSVLTSFSLPGFTMGDAGDIAIVPSHGTRAQSCGKLSLLVISALLAGLLVPRVAACP